MVAGRSGEVFPPPRAKPGREQQAQYARIQALYLQRTGERELVEAADALLDQVLEEWRGAVDLASTYLQKAACALVLSGADQSIWWLRKALQREREFRAALNEAERDHSGFRDHPTAGLVENTDSDFHQRLVKVAASG